MGGVQYNYRIFPFSFLHGDLHLSYKVDYYLSAPENHNEIVESCVFVYKLFFVYKLLTTTNVIIYYITFQEMWI